MSKCLGALTEYARVRHGAFHPSPSYVRKQSTTSDHPMTVSLPPKAAMCGHQIGHCNVERRPGNLPALLLPCWRCISDADPVCTCRIVTGEYAEKDAMSRLLTCHVNTRAVAGSGSIEFHSSFAAIKIWYQVSNPSLPNRPMQSP